MMTPIVNGLRSDYGREVNFVYASLDRQSSRDLAQKHGLVGYPVVLLLDCDGNSVGILRGVVPRTTLENAIDELIAQQ